MIRLRTATSLIVNGGYVANGTPGSVLFLDANKMIGEDNANFFWNYTSAKLGLGVTSGAPAKLNILTTDGTVGQLIDLGNSAGRIYTTFSKAGTGASATSAFHGRIAQQTDTLVVQGGDAAAGAIHLTPYNGGSYSANLGLFLDSSGRVGINNGAPGTFLHVKSTSQTQAIFERSSSTPCGIRLTCGTVDWDFHVESTGQFALFNVDTALYAILADSSNRLAFGHTSPTATLHPKAGSTDASSAPLKFISGSLMSTAEVGAFEFLTDKYYATITTGAARKELALADFALTQDRVVFTTTNGRIKDSSNFTFNNATAQLTGDFNMIGTLAMGDGNNIATQTTTGTKIGTATNQKIAFWNTTPVIQPADVAALASPILGNNLTYTADGTLNDTSSFAEVDKNLGELYNAIALIVTKVNLLRSQVLRPTGLMA